MAVVKHLHDADTDAAGGQKLNVGGSGALYIDANTNNNVGIGTTNPQALLHVKASNPYIITQPTSDDGEQTGIVMTDASGYHIAKLDTNSSSGEISIGSTHSNYYPVFYSGNAEIMRITTGGNVGIGTTNPGEKLEVNGKLKMGDNIVLNGHYLSGDGGNEGIIVDSSGNVGIGTNSPASLLDLGSGENGSYVQKFLLIHSGNARAGWGHASYEDRLFFPSDGHMSFGTISLTDGSTWAEKVRINNDGNVGIGTTNPVNKFHVRGSGTTATSLTDSAANYMGVFQNDVMGDSISRVAILSGGSTGKSVLELGASSGSDDGAITYDIATSTLSFQTNSVADRLKIDADGKVHIANELYITGSGYGLRVNTVFNVDTDGKVGIGTVSPTAALDVKKSIDASSGSAYGVRLRLNFNSFFV